MRSLSYFFTVTLLTLTFISCEEESSSDVNPSRIRVDYTVFFNENDNSTTATAQFFFGLQVLELVSPSKVTFEGQSMPFIDIINWHEVKLQGKVNDGTYVFTDSLGNVFTNVIGLDNTIAYPQLSDEVSRTADFTITWEGPALQADERVSLLITGVDLNSELVIEDAIGATSITVPQSRMSNLALGSATLRLDRFKEKTVQEAGEAGASARSKYRPENVRVTIVE